MGKLSQFIIVLNQPQAIFSAGQWIQGNVNLTLNEAMKMRGIQLELKGSAYVHWSEQHSEGSGKNRRTVTRHYSASETYFNFSTVMFGNAGGMFADSTFHPAGNYTYPFQFQLPMSLPSSFEGAHGHVRYYARAVIDRPWKFDHKTKQPFTIISNYDLNTIPDVLTSPQGMDTKTLCCLCCASGPIEATVRLNRKGYVPGENIQINAEITNNSSRTVKYTKAELIQSIAFHATTKTRWTSHTVAQLRHGEIGEGGHDTWSGELLHIPPLPPSNLEGCRIIDIKYTLKFIVAPSGPSLNLKIPLDVIIGTIPLRSYFNDYATAAANAGFGMAAAPYPPPAAAYPPPANYSDPSAPPLPGASAYPSSLPPSAPLMPAGAPPDAPPPSYKESVFGRVDIHDDQDNQYTMGETAYAPVYPYYNWNAANYSLPEQEK